MTLPIPVPSYPLPGMPEGRPVRVELTAATILVFSANGAKLLECARTIEMGEIVADTLSALRLVYEAQGLRDSMRRWTW